MSDSRSPGVSRRSVLRATGGTAAGLAVAGTAGAQEGDGCHYDTMHGHGGGETDTGAHNDPLQRVLCPDHPHAKTGPGHTMDHFDAAMGGCPTGTGLEDCESPADWPDCTNWPDPTKAIIRESREALTTVYNDVGTLVADGYIPYFDVLRPGIDAPGEVPFEDGVSHWLNPEYINDTTAKPDPWRPESVMLENTYWSPIGPMFIGTDEGDTIHDVDTLWGYTDQIRDDGVDYDDGIEGNDDREVVWHAGYDGPAAAEELTNEPCGPCHAMHGHDGLPGRFAWWYYRQVHEGDYASGDVADMTLPCYTAPMMHAWIYPTPAGPHSPTAGAPTHGLDPGRLPNRPGLPTPAVPGEDPLTLDVLPESVRERAMPDWLAAELRVIDALPTEVLQTATIGDLEDIVAAATVTDSLF